MGLHGFPYPLYHHQGVEADASATDYVAIIGIQGKLLLQQKSTLSFIHLLVQKIYGLL